MKVLLGRSLNHNQLLILSEIGNHAGTITSFLNHISRRHSISLSTLKLNAKILRELGLISYSEFQTANMTEFGKIIKEVLG